MQACGVELRTISGGAVNANSIGALLVFHDGIVLRVLRAMFDVRNRYIRLADRVIKHRNNSKHMQSFRPLFGQFVI
jgi:hypothetical protein